ncbi:metallophosphoesterase [Wenzhouxiangella sp. XN79A]|uniref:calcineurin-like phosphoesterase C-terminal domain-containing protein n=1 Tax=Wenzhouxiangella sp. XN79A TaxID=2724193 RepID=UPI00144AC031|nr:calcineurin-like phosphoesterase C-terminal domain-containing protein [Wenzhouxiangella sp. XN79A]NKI34771.1 metallophosphoesterase [Wenzhouxiangella sp. XN79A]
MSRALLAITVLAWIGVSMARANAPYIGSPQVGDGAVGAEAFTGRVFEDLDRDSVFDDGEPGVPGVRVSNGLDWVMTDAEGRYSIGARNDMNLTIVQPAGWRVPVDDKQLPQFFYVHKPGGTPTPLRFGGLPDTGPVPASVNFPLVRRTTTDDAFRCAVFGDTQAYSNQEIDWLRDGPMTDLLDEGLGADGCLLYVGDVVGDDLGLLPRLMEIGASAGAPQWLVHGNHDFDFDAASDDDSADSWRRIIGPEYYAFERGEVLFVVLDNVVYPCGPAPADAKHEFCGDPERPTYNGRISDEQMTWLAGLLDTVPMNRKIVIATHIPLVSFVDSRSPKHQTDNSGELHALLAGRPALALSGHTHTVENHAPGQHFEGWADNAGVDALPFRHIVAGAGSGAWFAGDFDIDGNPMTLQRMGAPSGVLLLDFDGIEVRERYRGSRIDPDRRQWLGLNTPAFRHWFETIMDWREQDRDTRDPVPPYSINDLPDTGLLTPADLTDGTWLTVNVWAGSSESGVAAVLTAIDGTVTELNAVRTQSGSGEAPKIGAEWADPFAAQRQLSVARWALESTLGEDRAQGFEQFKGSRRGPDAPQPQGAVADRNMHLWRARLPADLAPGIYTAEVTSIDRHGEWSVDRLLFEVRPERPPRHFRTDVWNAGAE